MTGRSRRLVLAGVLGTLAGTAGCLQSTGSDGDGTPNTGTTSTGPGSTSDGTTDATTTDSETVGDARTVDGRTVGLASARATRFLVTLLSGTHPSVSADRDRQYVVVELDVASEKPWQTAMDACELRVDERAVEPVSEVVQPFEDRTYLAFSLAVDVDVTDVALAWVGSDSTATWTLPEGIAAALESPPAFEVRSFSVPSTASGDEVEVSFGVANVG